MSKTNILDEKISILRGISDKRTALFSKLGIKTCGDLLWHLPRDYEDWERVSKIDELEDGETACILADVVSIPYVHRRGRRSQTYMTLRDDSGSLRAIWFNQPWIAKQIKKGELMRFRGRVKRSGRYFTLQNPDFVREGEDIPALQPIYPLTEGINQKLIRDAVKQILTAETVEFREILPQDLRREKKLAARSFAFEQVHFPESLHAAEIARKSLAFEELFLTMLGLRFLKSERQDIKRKPLILSEEKKQQIANIIDSLPYNLTESQKETFKAIADDFMKPYPAYRLIQGDVGSGKTVVAMLAIVWTALAGEQAVLMAPTSILAQQHFEKLEPFLAKHNIRTALLQGSMPVAKRREILQASCEGSIDCLIGTHALLSPDVRYKSLSLCITDEQHRFGVEQRLELSEIEEERGLAPHVIVMSATPIPRSLAMVIYGDLDVSEMRDMPSGRQPIGTYTARSKDRERVRRLVDKEIDKGHIAYIVCPTIEDSEIKELISAEKLFKELKEGYFSHRRLALLHGRLSNQEKDEIMSSLSQGKIDILVSTSVIEVGIDQKEATILVVENAERFGLAQLHQMRGRVGRSHYKSYCILMSDTDDPLARSRLTALCKHGDGFEVAEADLKLRGPGDFFGVRQSGLPKFRACNPFDDQKLLYEAAEAAEKILADDPKLHKVENRALLDEFKNNYAERLQNPAI